MVDQKHPRSNRKRVSLYIDNQAIVKALTGNGHSSGQHLIQTIITAINGLPCNTTVRWISSHSEVKGNEAADRMAKEAAHGRSSRRADLPNLLRSALPISISAAKEKFQVHLNRRWAKVWTNSPRKDKFAQIDPDFPFNKFRKKLFKLTRSQSSLIMQLRTGHIPLNFYLRRIGKIDSDKCIKCGNTPGAVQVPETINHFLFDCQSYDEARLDLIAKIGRNHFTLLKFMKNTDSMKALATYINRRGLFKDT
jgi:hypothetical protein